MPPKKPIFGRGHGRHSQRNKDKRSTRENKSPVKIKEENLRNIGHLVSPDRTKRAFTIKKVLEILRAQDDTEYRENDLREMLTVWRKYKKLDSESVKKMSYQQVTQELQSIQKRLLGDEENEYTIDEIMSILRSHRNVRYQLENIEPDDMKQMVKTWRKHNDEDIKGVDAMKDLELKATLEAIKLHIENNESSKPNASITEEVDKETDELFETVDRMNVNSETTNEKIKQYSKDQLATFYYIKSLKTNDFPSLEEAHTLQKEDLIDYCREWRNKAKSLNEQDFSSILLSSEDEDDKYDKPTIQKDENVDDIEIIPESVVGKADREKDDIFKVVENMNFNENTTEENILNHNDEELAYFQYVHSLQMKNVPDMDSLKDLERTALVSFCKEWVEEAQLKKSKDDDMERLRSETEDELYELNESNTENQTFANIQNSNEDEDAIMTDREEDEMSNESTATSPMEIDNQEPQIDLNSVNTIQKFQKLEQEHKCLWIRNKSVSKEEPVHLESIRLWSDDQLTKTAQTLMNDDNSKGESYPSKSKSNLKKNSKYTKKILTQTDLHKNTMNSWRYSLFLTSPPNKKGIDGLRTYLADIFHEMGSFCPGIQLLQWDDETNEEGIEDCEDIPQTINQLKKYFKGIRSPTGVAKQYLKIRLGYPITSDRPTFEADIMGWCKDREIRMYECALQHPNSKVIGWLVYAPNTIDRQKWCIATQELYSIANKNGRKEEIKIGIAWKALNGQWDVPQKEKVYAFHVETSVEQATRIKKFLRLVAHNKKYPLGVRFRLSDEFNQYMKETSKLKYNYMLDKHKTLSKEMRQVEATSILNLDKKIGNTRFTLRDIIINIRDKTDNRRVFNSIDQKYNNPSAYIAQYRPDKAELAKAHIFSLATYVKYLYPEAKLNKIFTIDALDEAEVEIYYPNTQTFLTQEDIDFDAVIQDDLDDDSFEYLNINNTNPFEIQIPEKLKGGEKLYNLNGDDDTASTMPAHSSTISFTNASVHLYDTKSLASEISSISENKKSTPNSTKSVASKKESINYKEAVHKA